MKIGITCYPTYGGSGVLASELGKFLAKRGPGRIGEYVRGPGWRQRPRLPQRSGSEGSPAGE